MAEVVKISFREVSRIFFYFSSIKGTGGTYVISSRVIISITSYSGARRIEESRKSSCCKIIIAHKVTEIACGASTAKTVVNAAMIYNPLANAVRSKSRVNDTLWALCFYV